MKTASEMTSIVSGGAINSTPTKPNSGHTRSSIYIIFSTYNRSFPVSSDGGSTLGPGGGHAPPPIVARPPNLAELLTHCGQIIFRKCHKMSDFKAKMQKIRFPLRLRLDTGGAAYSAPPDPLAVFKGPTSKGNEGEEGGEGKC